MKKHLVLVCMAYLFFGIGIGVQCWGIKAGLGLWTTMTIFISSYTFFIIIVLTSLNKIKEVLNKYDLDQKTKFDFESDSKV